MRRITTLACLGILLITQVGLAESTDYHLKRLEIQAKAFLAVLGAEPMSEPSPTPAQAVEAIEDSTLMTPLPDGQQSRNLNQQLEEVAEPPSWARNMVVDDLRSLIAASESLRGQLQNGDSEEYLRAKVELESMARRLRISTSPLDLDPQDNANLQLLMLELEEATASISEVRQQKIAQNDSRRRRNRTRINVGVGFGGWGGWGPWNRWGWSPYGYRGFYRPYRRVYRRRCR